MYSAIGFLELYRVGSRRQVPDLRSLQSRTQHKNRGEGWQAQQNWQCQSHHGKGGSLEIVFEDRERRGIISVLLYIFQETISAAVGSQGERVQDIFMGEDGG